MIARQIRPRVAEALTDTPVVMVMGARQAGKSELRGVLGADPQDVRDALEAWRSEEPPPAHSGSSYVDYLT
jgi:hypothetical protein